VFDVSPVQIIIVLAIALLIFGPKRLPEMGRHLGRGIRDFKDGIAGSTPTQPTAGSATRASVAEEERAANKPPVDGRTP
jgi:sec-independent protein translocase protein TatA